MQREAYTAGPQLDLLEAAPGGDFGPVSPIDAGKSQDRERVAGNGSQGRATVRTATVVDAGDSFEWLGGPQRDHSLPPAETTAAPKKACACEGPCVYCGRRLLGRHEHDHFPTPARHGGKLVVATCLDCHGLKDRRVKGEWPVDALVEAVAGCSTPLARIVMAGLLADWQDLRAENERLSVGTPDTGGAA